MHLPAIQPFDLDVEWLRAQAFRWTEPDRDRWTYGFVGGALIRVRQRDDGIEFESDASDEGLKPHVINYFRLDQDITGVHQALRATDTTGTMSRLIERHGGMRILRQDPWECVAAYICSQNNSVERITSIVDRLASTYGVEHTLGGVTSNAVPTPRRLVEVGSTELDGLGFGLSRGNRIHTVAKDITEGYLDLHALSQFRYRQVKGLLMSYDGIGAKIADCVCLFALDKPEAFPVDRHIARALEPYGQTYTAGAPNAGLKEWVHDTFGANAGYAGQLLFLDQLDKSNGSGSA